MNGYLSTAVVTDSLQRIMSRCRAGILSHFLHRVGFTLTSCHQHVCRLLPCISTLTTEVAVYFCCTFLEVASTGRYPALLLCGARTFLVSFPTQPFGCLLRRKCTTFFVFCQRMKAQGRLLCPEPTFFAVCSRFVLVPEQTFQLFVGVWLVCSKFLLCNTIVLRHILKKLFQNAVASSYLFLKNFFAVADSRCRYFLRKAFFMRLLCYVISCLCDFLL